MDKRITVEHGYTVTGLKTWNTRDGGGFQCTLRRNGKPVAEVTNDGHGGGFEYEWRDLDKRDAPVRFMTHEGEIKTYTGTAEEAKLWAKCLELPPFEYHGTTLTINPDMFVEELVGDLEIEKAVKKALKYPSIIFKDQLLQFKKHPLDKELRDYIARTYPSAIILNDLPLADAVKAYQTAK